MDVAAGLQQELVLCVKYSRAHAGERPLTRAEGISFSSEQEKGSVQVIVPLIGVYPEGRDLNGAFIDTSGHALVAGDLSGRLCQTGELFGEDRLPSATDPAKNLEARPGVEGRRQLPMWEFVAAGA